MVFDITLVCSGLMTKLVYRTTFCALFQLKSLERRLGKDLNLKKQYCSTIRDNFSKGCIVKVEKCTCLKTDQPREWYIPHHIVFHSHKPGKVRQFLNGAAKFEGHPLTNELLTWPDLLQNLFDVLLRLRKHPYAVSAEIKGMFQVRVIPKDQPFLPFLWREDRTTEVAVFQYTRQNFGSKEWPICANYALQQTATDNQSEFPETSESVRNNFYIDGYLKSSQTVERTTQKAQDLVKLFILGCFTQTKFVKNVPSISTQFQHGRKSPKNHNKVLPTVAATSHVLDLRWNP